MMKKNDNIGTRNDENRNPQEPLSPSKRDVSKNNNNNNNNNTNTNTNTSTTTGNTTNDDRTSGHKRQRDPKTEDDRKRRRR